MDITSLTFIRECTSHGIAAHWRLNAAGLRAWHSLGHLYPPTNLTDTGTGDDVAALERWSSTWGSASSPPSRLVIVEAAASRRCLRFRRARTHEAGHPDDLHRRRYRQQ